MDLGMSAPNAFYWGAGVLSSFLDNAPTYLTYLSAAHGLAGMSVGPDQTPLWIHLNPVGCTAFSAEQFLLALSLGSVFFGANTYIGNGPNFMMKTIAEDEGVEMPSFFGYVVKYTLPIMVPVLALIWLLFIR
jgi:Na+/H+ antiporter NhaD/arsenite permease-like protein